MAIKNLADIEALERTSLTDRHLSSNTYTALQLGAQVHNEAPALSFFLDATRYKHTHRWSYRALFADITRTANMFHDLGIGAQDVVAFILPNLPETHFTIWGAQAVGIVMAINPLLDAAQISTLLLAANAKVVVTLAPTPSSELWPKLSEQLPNLPFIQQVLWVSMAPYVDPARGLALRWMARLAKRRHPEVRIADFRMLMKQQPATHLKSTRTINAQDYSSYFCTGGTTGAPKIAKRTHGAEVFNVWAMAANMYPREPGKIIFCGLPLFHVNGQAITGLLPWTQGDHVILGTPQGFRGAGVLPVFWAIVEHFKINYFSGVPTVYSALLQQPVGAHDISSLDYALCGAAPMPVELFNAFERRIGVRILEGYGLTEGTCVSSSNPPEGERRIGSIGLRLAYQRMRSVVLDDQGGYLRDAQTDENGVIVINGPNVFAGYLQEAHNQDLWVSIEGEQWLNTGDLGRQDAQGYFWLTGRKKELIIRGGHNIDPRQIEEVLQSHPAVALVAAIGCPDAHAGEVPVAYVQLKSDRDVGSAELLAFARERIIEPAAVPKRIEIMQTLPLTAIGKIYKPALVHLEVGGIIREEAAAAGIEDIVIDVVQDAHLGLLAKIYTNTHSEVLKRTLGQYTFQVQWLEQPFS
ncbi:acyl-CoA synthetase [Pseudomonas yamanorum]|uniref:acyl-CoA synthetase n=1 Tax=Pseudomonas yamanorum TaxID=515393 RepID=UPI001C4371DC|nr:acyl-CoA synthetase [Pseudomonas yamanorum]MBV6659734.1 acyl-CoA synthetase [Pseudomonas yamanorum]